MNSISFSLIDKTIQTLPDKPGIYQFLDENDKILYVGKAKSIRKRVNSYFSFIGNKAHKQIGGKTWMLIRKTKNIKYIVVHTEYDALLLENTLIKKHQPRYNILLKDDKTFPWICLKKEPFPRIFSTRTLINDGSQYFGPYASVKMMKTVLDLVKQLYPLRNCNYHLSKANIQKKKFKICLEYHIGNCKGACEGLETEKEYNQSIEAIKHIIKGNIHTVTSHLVALMKTYANNLEFEKSQWIKEKIELLEKFKSKSTVVNPKIINADVFSIVTDDKYGYVNYLKVVKGAIVQGHTIELKKKLDESREELLLFAIMDLKQRIQHEEFGKELLVPFPLSFSIPTIKLSVPLKGDKKKLLELSERNAKLYMMEKHKQWEKINPQKHVQRILEQMKTDLRLKELPKHIECFDNSNLQGTTSVAACVVFKNTRPSKKDYRHFTIKTVTGQDDYASMEEIVYRRYKRLIEEQKHLPQLIVIDGGKGQLSAAIKSLTRVELNGKIGIIGIAKKLEEIYYPNDSIPLYLDKKSETLKVLQHIRNEAHRFGITHHRKKKTKETITSELLEIKRIGFKTTQQLLSAFFSVKNIKEASHAELAKVIHSKKAQIVFDYFHP